MSMTVTTTYTLHVPMNEMRERAIGKMVQSITS